MKKYIYILPLFILILAGCGGRENKHIRDGNIQYADSNYTEAIDAYKKAVEANPDSYKAKYNLAAAYYKLKQYREAAKLLKELIPIAESDTTKLAHIYYNLGNAILLESLECEQKNLNMTDSVNNQQSMIDSESSIVKKVDLGVQLDSMIVIQDSISSAKDTFLLASIGSYKNSLRYDCRDMDAKYNLVYAMKLLPKDLQNSGSDQNKTEPSEFAVKLKEQADSLILIYKFSEAYDLLDKGILKDTTVKSYNDFIKKLKDVKDIL
jgi:tetratricopeptide (TPR) repeat protein